jgi:RNA polymerase sigma factor (sigma-70 family)
LTADTPYNEKELLEQVALGNEQAFAALFHAWYPLLASQVLSIVRSVVITEEIVQDVFLKIWMTRESLRDIDNMRGYVWVMANNRSYTALRKIALEKAQKAGWLVDQANMPAQEEAPNDSFLSLLEVAIAKLPPQQQKVFLLSRRERMRQADIAAEMDITVTTVKKYLQRATEAISRFMKDHYPLLYPILHILYWH